ncbi:MAG TPA: hypothetical protein VF828_04140 [Patescibacteria group bacterium]
MSHCEMVGLTDNDGVLSRSHIPVLHEVNRRLIPYGLKKPIGYADLDNWNYIEQTAFGLTGSRNLAHEINETWFNPQVLRRSPPYHFRLLTYQYYQQAFPLRVDMATTRRPSCYDSTFDWCRQHAPWLANQGRLHFNFNGTSGDDFKVSQAVKYQPLFFVEDNPSTIHALHSAGYYDTLMPTHPWNSSHRELDPWRINNDFSLFLAIGARCLRYRRHSS